MKGGEFREKDLDGELDVMGYERTVVGLAYDTCLGCLTGM